MQWLITYLKVNDRDAPQYTETVNAPTFTEALVYFTIHYKNYIAIEINLI